jgi:hypothetical protein
VTIKSKIVFGNLTLLISHNVYRIVRKLQRNNTWDVNARYNQKRPCTLKKYVKIVQYSREKRSLPVRDRVYLDRAQAKRFSEEYRTIPLVIPQKCHE